MTTAQQIANLAATDFPAAVRLASSEGYTRARWFAGHERVFADGSVVTFRSGKIESPTVSFAWTAAKRIEFDV